MNLIVRLLLDLGLIKLKEGDWKDIKAQQDEIKKQRKIDEKEDERRRFEEADYSHDPITAPRRMPDQDDYELGWRTLLPVFIIGAVVISLLVWASEEWVWSDTSPDKLNRAEWINKTNAMSCVDLKKIVESCYWDRDGGYSQWGDEARCDTESTGISFSYWEYISNTYLYPTTDRPIDQCYIETGGLRVHPEKCEGRSSAMFGCGDQGYLYPRDEANGIMYFPKGWHYLDPFTMEHYDDPNEFLRVYHPDLANEYNAEIDEELIRCYDRNRCYEGKWIEGVDQPY